RGRIRYCRRFISARKSYRDKPKRSDKLVISDPTSYEVSSVRRLKWMAPRELPRQSATAMPGTTSVRRGRRTEPDPVLEPPSASIEPSPSALLSSAPEGRRELVPAPSHKAPGFRLRSRGSQC